jgi:hypothetical protein
MATLEVIGSSVGTCLQSLLLCDDIVPGSEPSYELCKIVYLYHPLGKKMVEKPIDIAMSQQRQISIPNSPEEAVRDAFLKEWGALGVDNHIFNVMRLSRIYGIASVAYGALGVPTNKPIDPTELAQLDLYFSVFDPMNTAGSLVLNQDPNAPDFQKHSSISVNGQPYHRSRACTIMNEEPIYISYTSSAFGFVGRSVYQRALFPLKSFVQSMITDDLVTRKAGVIIAKTKQAGSIVDRMMQKTMGLKRNYIKEAETGNVISIGTEEDIGSIDLKNADTGMTVARKNILENIASAASMPAKMLNNETLAEGFGEGTEDAKSNAEFINGIREEMQSLYTFFDKIVQYRAWNPEFYKTIQAQFPEFKNVSYKKAFYDWTNSFEAKWPSLLIEPESELAKIDEIKLKSAIAATEVLLPNLDPDNRAALIDWLALSLNDNKMLFKHPLMLDIDALRNYTPPTAPEDTNEPTPFSGET